MDLEGGIKNNNVQNPDYEYDHSDNYDEKSSPGKGAGHRNSHSDNHLLRQIMKITVLFSVIAVSTMALHNSANPLQFLSTSSATSSSVEMPKDKLEMVLKNAANEDKTVILTSLNDAWAEPNSTFDLFLESFRIGNGTQKLLKNVVVIALDQKAYARCLAVHPHCYAVTTAGSDFSKGEAYFMTPDYLKLVLKKIEVLLAVLQRGYNFIFTDSDIMWFRDPFPQFYPEADLQVSCDSFFGNSSDINNPQNTGLLYVKSNNRTIKFHEYWNSSRDTYPGMHDQDLFNTIKYDNFTVDIGIKMRFLDTTYFGGLCQLSTDFNKVCTMHANCCFGLDMKTHDLGVMLQDWRNYMALSPEDKVSNQTTWNVPHHCSVREYHPPQQPKMDDQEQQEGHN